VYVPEFVDGQNVILMHPKIFGDIASANYCAIVSLQYGNLGNVKT